MESTHGPAQLRFMRAGLHSTFLCAGLNPNFLHAGLNLTIEPRNVISITGPCSHTMVAHSIFFVALIWDDRVLQVHTYALPWYWLIDVLLVPGIIIPSS